MSPQQVAAFWLANLLPLAAQHHLRQPNEDLTLVLPHLAGRGPLTIALDELLHRGVTESLSIMAKSFVEYPALPVLDREGQRLGLLAPVRICFHQHGNCRSEPRGYGEPFHHGQKFRGIPGPSRTRP